MSTPQITASAPPIAPKIPINGDIRMLIKSPLDSAIVETKPTIKPITAPAAIKINLSFILSFVFLP